RGQPYEILCDQGSNFRGAVRELKETFQNLTKELQVKLETQQIKFKFNPPQAPHFGGSWEREIRSIKTALRVVLGGQTTSIPSPRISFSWGGEILLYPRLFMLILNSLAVDLGATVRSLLTNFGQPLFGIICQ
ncbi:hypothetical protein M9458_032181, partial [Cirrhinus mrigala]